MCFSFFPGCSEGPCSSSSQCFKPAVHVLPNSTNRSQLLFLRLHYSVKSSWLHCECRDCWETDDVFCRHSGVTTCPVRIRVSRKVPKTGSEVLMLVKACPPVCCSPPVVLWFHVWRHLGTKGQSKACPLRWSVICPQLVEFITGGMLEVTCLALIPNFSWRLLVVLQPRKKPLTQKAYKPSPYCKNPQYGVQ